MGIIKEFQEFAVKGNVVDLAVGVIIGGAFGKIVSSFVADVVTPPLGLLIGGVDFTSLAITLKAKTAEAPAVVLGYGKFLQACFDFVIVAWAIFMVIKAMNALKRKEVAASAAPAEPPAQEKLLAEIRDLLKAKK